MKMLIFTLIIYLVGGLFSLDAHAQPAQGASCYYNNNWYPDGFIREPYQCRDGVWVRISN